MTRKMLIGALVVFILSSCNQGQESSSSVSLNNEQDSLSYYIGISFGNNLVTSGIDSFNFAAMRKGLEDGFGENTDINPEMVRMYIMTYMDKLDRKEAGANEAEGTAWLKQNEGKEGVKVAPEGYQYKVLTEGSGESPTAQDTVVVNYTGKLVDGTIFDSSIERGFPAKFPVDKVIKGWTLALQQMKVGSKWELYIPAFLAYGQSRGPGGDLPPGSTLIFEVELMEIVKAQ